MTKLRIFQVDAFTEKLFAGNPAAVCILEKWLSDELMQSIAMENNLAETAFVVPRNDTFQIRWFTPTVEVDLCGHATLASAHVLFECLGHQNDTIDFFSTRSGDLRVFRRKELLFLDFPTDSLKASDDNAQVSRSIGVEVLELYKGKSDYVAFVQDEETVAGLRPVFSEIGKLPARGLIVTAAGNSSDFVSRFFAPQSGIDEDPVTGSAHTSLIPLWSSKLGKNEMKARQLSPRGGTLICTNKGDRCFIGGKAKLYLAGEIMID